MAEYPTIKADDRGTDITFRTLLLQQLPQDNLYKRERCWGRLGGERKQNYPGFIVERTGWWLEIAIFKVNSIQLKGADKIQIFEKKI